MFDSYYQNQAAHVPVRLFLSGGLPATGIGSGSLTFTALKSDGSTAAVTPTSWTEISTGGFSGLGVYDMVVPASITDKVGPLTIAVSGSTAQAVASITVMSALPVDVISNVWAAS